MSERRARALPYLLAQGPSHITSPRVELVEGDAVFGNTFYGSEVYLVQMLRGFSKLSILEGIEVYVLDHCSAQAYLWLKSADGGKLTDKRHARFAVASLY